MCALMHVCIFICVIAYFIFHELQTCGFLCLVGVFNIMRYAAAWADLSFCVWKVHLCLTCHTHSFGNNNYIVFSDEITLFSDKEEAINIQFLMQSRSKFCQNCNAVIERGMKMRPGLFASAQEQVVNQLIVLLQDGERELTK